MGGALCDARRLLVTGASGWIGRALMDSARSGASGTLERPPTSEPADVRESGFEFRAVNARQDLSVQFDTARRAGHATGATLVHLAALAHRQGPQDARRYQEVNCQLALRTAEAAAAAGVVRFVFVSTARVMGEVSVRPWVETDPPAPSDAYSCAKWQAEQQLMALHHKGTIEVVIVRPPLVYGPGVRANFLRLLSLADSRWPIPVCTPGGLRSMVFIDTLVSALKWLACAQQASGRTCFVSDHTDWTTPALIGRLRELLGRPPRLVPLPCAALRATAIAAGRKRLFDRLFGASQVCGQALLDLGWEPPAGADAGLQRTVQWWQSAASSPNL